MSKFTKEVLASAQKYSYKLSLHISKTSNDLSKENFFKVCDNQKDKILNTLNNLYENINYQTIYREIRLSSYAYYIAINIPDNNYFNYFMAKNYIDAVWHSWFIPYSQGGLDRGGKKSESYKTERANFLNLMKDTIKFIERNKSIENLAYENKIHEAQKELLSNKNDEISKLKKIINKYFPIYKSLKEKNQSLVKEMKDLSRLNFTLNNEFNEFKDKSHKDEDFNELKKNYEYEKKCVKEIQSLYDNKCKENISLNLKIDLLESSLKKSHQSVIDLKNKYNLLYDVLEKKNNASNNLLKKANFINKSTLIITFILIILLLIILIIL